MIETLEIVIPIPPPATHPNARSPAWLKRKCTRTQRGDAHLAAIHAMNSPSWKGDWKPHWDKAIIDVVLHKPGSKAKAEDEGNIIAHLKASEDGLQDAGVILNDRGVKWGTIKQLIGKAAKERKVVLRVRELDD